MLALKSAGLLSAKPGAQAPQAGVSGRPSVPLASSRPTSLLLAAAAAFADV